MKAVLKKCLLVALLMLVCAPLAQAQHKTFTKKDGFFSIRNKLDVYFFNADTHRLMVRDEGSVKTPRYGSIDKAMRKSPCIAGGNGGFFGADVDGMPLGLVIQNGKRLTPLASGSFAVAGVVYEGVKGPVLVRSVALKKMRRLPLMRAAIQGGPFLVENAKPTTGRDDTNPTNRTFNATDGDKNWCIGISSPLTLKELSLWLSAPDALGKDFKVKDALNLDGGSSSAFWCHETGVSYPSYKQVRNYLGVAPREKDKIQKSKDKRK